MRQKKNMEFKHGFRRRGPERSPPVMLRQRNHPCLKPPDPKDDEEDQRACNLFVVGFADVGHEAGEGPKGTSDQDLSRRQQQPRVIHRGQRARGQGLLPAGGNYQIFF